jgi:hypothetical protein
MGFTSTEPFLILDDMCCVKVGETLSRLIQINDAYRDVEVDNDALGSLPENDCIQGTFVETANTDDTSTETAEALSEGPGLQESSTLSHVVRHSMLTLSGDNRSAAQRVQQAALGTNAHMRLGKAVYMHHKDQWKYAFPKLFPFGRGSPDDKAQKVPIALSTWVKHALRLSHRQFQLNPDFIFTAADTAIKSEYVICMMLHYGVGSIQMC